ncbi:MAG: hypothetical protein GY701_20505 [Sulfitobacter sp.]|nr:hypothetical protein [Sulfitobacter sp.]
MSGAAALNNLIIIVIVVIVIIIIIFIIIIVIVVIIRIRSHFGTRTVAVTKHNHLASSGVKLRGVRPGQWPVGWVVGGWIDGRLPVLARSMMER